MNAEHLRDNEVSLIVETVSNTSFVIEIYVNSLIL